MQFRRPHPPRAKTFMPRAEKWLSNVREDTPAPRAARQALKPRLLEVAKLLGDAAHVTGKSDKDAEAVHQLRIWSRRSAAALRLFGELLPRRTAKWLKRKLKEIRRAAGSARDCDVLAERIEAGELPGLKPKAFRLHQRRRRAEKEMAALYKSLVKSGKFERKTDKLLEKLARRGKQRRGQSKSSAKWPAFGPWCQEQLAPLRDDFLRAAASNLSRDADLHALRLAGKRLRYALELSPAALPAGVHRRLYDELTDLQDRLGEVCDRIATVGRLKLWRRDAGGKQREDFRAALHHEQAQLSSGKQRFLRWWSAKRRKSLAARWRKALVS
jgi:CHAD domain-containing protein